MELEAIRNDRTRSNREHKEVIFNAIWIKKNKEIEEVINELREMENDSELQDIKNHSKIMYYMRTLRQISEIILEREEKNTYCSNFIDQAEEWVKKQKKYLKKMREEFDIDGFRSEIEGVYKYTKGGSWSSIKISHTNDEIKAKTLERCNS